MYVNLRIFFNYLLIYIKILMLIKTVISYINISKVFFIDTKIKIKIETDCKSWSEV